MVNDSREIQNLGPVWTKNPAIFCISLVEFYQKLNYRSAHLTFMWCDYFLNTANWN